ncbi:unnamed protein product [Ilex paraguariensis]|uniref:Uncharacterized protein n=1 Tax=Ilex paraguariensis TaxID=185542 RepID=A0ABC8QNA0_9AQUA
MRTTRRCCHTFLAFILKFVNFLQTFVGLSIVIYSAYMLNQWHNNHSQSPVHLPPSPDFPDAILSNFDAVKGPDHVTPLNLAANVVSGLEFNVQNLPAPWFIYAFMGVGVVDLPFDPTGELYRIRAFIENNVEVCKWVGISLVVIQVLSLLLAMILRAMVSIRREDSDIEGGYDVSNRTPLLNPQLSQTYGSIKGIRTHSDSWSSRMREKVSL